MYTWVYVYCIDATYMGSDCDPTVYHSTKVGTKMKLKSARLLNSAVRHVVHCTGHCIGIAVAKVMNNYCPRKANVIDSETVSDITW